MKNFYKTMAVLTIISCFTGDLTIAKGAHVFHSHVCASTTGITASVNEQSSFTQQVCAVSSTNIGGLAASDGNSMTAGMEKRESSYENMHYAGVLEMSDKMVTLSQDVAVEPAESAMPDEVSAEPLDTPEPSDTPKPLDTPDPTDTPTPSDTPESTDTPTPSDTPEPTDTPTPSDTPRPTSTPKPSKKPKQKLVMRISQKKKKVTITWNKLEDVSSYLLYTKAQGGKFKKNAIRKGNKFSLSIEYGKTYYVKMAVKNKKNKVFSRTGKYSIYVPEKVGVVHTVSKGKTEMKLTWGAVRKAEIYYIYRKASGQKAFTLAGKKKKCAFVDEELKYGKNYNYKIIPATERKGYIFKGVGRGKFFSNKKLVSDSHQKYTYTEMEKDIKELAKKYYGMIHYKVIGKSEDGRNIYDVILGNQNASKSILVVSTLHAREYMASLVCMSQIEYYLQSSQEKIAGQPVNSVLNRIALHYIPMANPDGVTISQYGFSGIKNTKLCQKLSKISNGNPERWKANARGVDLNRNYPYQFKKSGKAGSEGYSGKSASSEAETQAIVALIKSLKQKELSGVINYHATGSIVFGGCTKKGRVKENTQKMYDLARAITGYADSAAYEKEHSGGTGSLREYIVYKQKVPSITLEVGWSPCPGPISEFPSIWSRNKTLVMEEAMLFL